MSSPSNENKRKADGDLQMDLLRDIQAELAETKSDLMATKAEVRELKRQVLDWNGSQHTIVSNPSQAQATAEESDLSDGEDSL